MSNIFYIKPSTLIKTTSHDKQYFHWHTDQSSHSFHFQFISFNVNLFYHEKFDMNMFQHFLFLDFHDMPMLMVKMFNVHYFSDKLQIQTDTTGFFIEYNSHCLQWYGSVVRNGTFNKERRDKNKKFILHSRRGDKNLETSLPVKCNILL